MFTLTHVWSVNTPERSESVWFPFKRHVWVKQTTNALQVQCLSSQHELRAHKHTFAAYLYFHGHLPAVLHPRQVNLADGRRRKRTLLEGLQLVPPVRTQVAVQRFLQTHTHTHTNRCYFCSLSFFQVNILSSPDLKLVLLYHSIMMKRRDTYRHLFDWHEVGALSDTVKDLGQLRVDEGIIWNKETRDFTTRRKIRPLGSHTDDIGWLCGQNKVKLYYQSQNSVHTAQG